MAAAAGPILSPPRHTFEVEPGVRLVYQIYAPPTATAATAAGAASTVKGALAVSPLLMIQGWTGVKEDWVDVPARLAADGRYVLVFDNRGMGESSVPTDSWPLDRMADDAVALARHVFADHLKAGAGRRCHVFGISMGGMISQLIALAYPEFVDRLVLGCTWSGASDGLVSETGGVNGGGFLGAAKRLGKASADAKANGKRLDKLSPTIRSAVREMLAFNYAPEWIAKHPTEFDAIVERSLSATRSARGMMLQLMALSSFDVGATVHGVSRPTLVVHGTADQLIDYRNAPLIHSKIAGSKLVTLRGVGHVFWNTDDDVSTNAIRQFLTAAASNSSASATAAAPHATVARSRL